MDKTPADGAGWVTEFRIIENWVIALDGFSSDAGVGAQSPSPAWWLSPHALLSGYDRPRLAERGVQCLGRIYDAMPSEDGLGKVDDGERTFEPRR